MLAAALAALALAACSSAQERATAEVKKELSAAGYSDARVLTLDGAGDQVQVVYTAKARNSSESSDEKRKIKELVWNVYPHKLTKITVQAVASDTLIAGTDEADSEEMQSLSGDRPPQAQRAPGRLDPRATELLAFLAGVAFAALAALAGRIVRRRPAAGPAGAASLAGAAPAGGGSPGWTPSAGRPEVRRPGATEPGRDHPARG
jgi:hypothetical protein